MAKTTNLLLQGNLDSGLRELFVCGIRDSGLWNPESKTITNN